MAHAAGQGNPDWTEPGLFTVAPGVHRIPLPLPNDGLRAVNVYAIESGDDLVLIDAGWALAETGGLLDAALARIDRSSAEITRCLVTHVHRDHYTMAVILRRRFGTHVALGIGDRPSLASAADAEHETMSEHVLRMERAGAEPVIRALRAAYGGTPPERDPDVWEQPDEWLKGQSTVQLTGRDLLAVPTPGHTQGHMVFADTERSLLFAGDHVLPRITPSVGFEAVMAEQPLRDYLRSLRLMLDMPDMRLLPAHGPVADSTHARVVELLAHHEDRLEACLNRIGAGAQTAYQAALALPWTRRERRFSELDPFNQMLAVLETGVHLDLLAVQGRLERTATPSLITYALPGPGPQPPGSQQAVLP
ncbi:MAG TPA: MBL fold metallo-hydrolase [Streptosporangiaceae bacterium]|nr:MBL fold metallo-hydrolase [Streptosporangiaceae bacterium]